MKSGAVIGLILLAFRSCDPPGDNRLWITNATPDSLYYFQAYERFPLPDKNPFTKYDAHNFYPYERRNFSMGSGSWAENITSNSPRDSVLLFYTFTQRTIENTPWATIRKRRLYTLYKLKLSELQRRNWKVALRGPIHSKMK